MQMRNRFSLWIKWLLFPGFDLHTRSRYRILPRYFENGSVDTLDAGFGNGAFSYAAYRKGNRVLGVTFDAAQVEKARALFSARRTDPERLHFELLNLYDLPKLQRQFDQIICSETLEHIKDDRRIISYFHDALRPGGVLHLCCPYSLNPEHHLGRTDNPEDGVGHVRDGYTFESYRALLEPCGFDIVERHGVGSPFLQKLDHLIRRVRNKFGLAAASPLFALLYPLTFFDRLDPEMPFSLYVKAIARRQ
jgi:SAM-dependent methyltransferase